MTAPESEAKARPECGAKPELTGSVEPSWECDSHLRYGAYQAGYARLRNQISSLTAALAEKDEQLQAVRQRVKEAIELLGVDAPVEGCIPDSWTLREQRLIAGKKLAIAMEIAAQYAADRDELRAELAAAQGEINRLKSLLCEFLHDRNFLLYMHDDYIKDVQIALAAPR